MFRANWVEARLIRAEQFEGTDMNVMRFVRFSTALLAFCITVGTALSEDAIPLLKTKTEDYANVTLVSQTATHVCIQHSRGMATIKLTSLDAQALIALGISTNVLTTRDSGATASKDAGSSYNSNQARPSVGLGVRWDSLKSSTSNWFRANVNALIFPITVLLIILNFAYGFCAKRFCKKAGYEPRFRVWIPMLRQLACSLRLECHPIGISWCFL